MIVGTAGHIDHGKTALVEALTGVDADRLREEKARGITIELGFVYEALDADRITGFVDVPGHERFVSTMLAGASGIDCALLLVAADDGVMPQTREHLAILDLLGVDRGLVALSKADLADAAGLERVGAEIREALAPTGLRDAAIIPVSSQTGEGVGTLRAALAALERDIPERGVGGRFRLAVDRCFSLAGAGTVVTGTVLSGTVAVGDRVVVSPSGRPARVRSLHAQNRAAATGRAGQRCALALAGEGIDVRAITRGDAVMDPALHAPSARIDAELRLLASESKPVRQWLPVRLHHASAEVGARVVLLDGPVEPGGTGHVQLVLDRPLPAVVGDRFVLREAGARRTIGGGRFLDLRPPTRRRGTPERLAQLAALGERDLQRGLGRLLRIAPFALEVAPYARDHGLTDPEMAGLLQRADASLIAAATGPVALSSAQRRRFTEHLVAEVERFHADNPDLQGIGRERLRLAVQPRLSPAAFVAALQSEAGDGRIVLEGAFVRLPGHAVRLTEADEAQWARVAPLLAGEGRFRPPRVRDVAGLLTLIELEVRRILKLCARLGRVDQIAQDHFFLRATTVEMVALARDAAAEDGAFTAATFRDRMDNGRKVAIQILDFFDRHGITLRRGDLRRINPHRLDLFGSPEPGREASPVGRPDFKSGWGSEPVPGGFDSRSLPPGGREP